MVSVALRTARVLPTALCLALAGLTTPVAAVAQSSQTRAPTTLTGFQLLAEGEDQSVFAVDFAPTAGSYSAVTTDATRPALLLLRTRAGQGAEPRQSFRGLVRSVDLEPTDSGMAIRFNTAVPAKVTAEPSGQRRLLVTVSRLSRAEAVGSRPIGSEDEPVVPATELPPALDPLPGEDGYELVMLKYADVSEIVGLLTDGITVKPNNIFIRREPGFGSPGTTNTTYVSPQTRTEQEQQPLGQSVDSSLAIDRRLNAIWIKGSPERIARIKDQIAMIDIPVDSVILETQFVELTEAGARAVGIDLANASGQIASGTIQTGTILPFGLERDVLPTGAIQAAIYAQIQKGQGRIVSTPRIAAQSGSTAKIITGDALPILTSILSGLNAVSQQVQYVNVGVTLQIAPRVSGDGYVTSHIYGVVSSVTGYSQGYPTISQREAETSASVRDGETFVIGGLTQENNLTNRSKIPLLGDIPLIGQAFRTNRSTNSKTELYIVITPHIVRHRRFESSNGQPALVRTPGASNPGPSSSLPPPPPPDRRVPRGSPLSPTGSLRR